MPEPAVTQGVAPHAGTPEGMAPHAGIPVLANAVLAGALTAGALAELILLPLLLRASPHWLWAGVAVGLFSNTHWSLIHEGMHGSLHPSPRVNERIARMLSIVFGIGFHTVRFGHLLHHRFNRCPIDRTEAYDPEHTPWWRAAGPYYLRLCGGLYAGEIVAGQATWLPRPLLRGVLSRALGAPDPAVRTIQRLAIRVVDGPQLGRMRTDATAAWCLYGASACLYGHHWPAAIALLALRGFLLSVLDNAFHYGTPLDSGRYARNLRLPRPMARWWLHFNWHHRHHLRPSLPWLALAPAREADRDAERVAIGVLRQFRGPIPLARMQD